MDDIYSNQETIVLKNGKKLMFDYRTMPGIYYFRDYYPYLVMEIEENIVDEEYDYWCDGIEEEAMDSVFSQLRYALKNLNIPEIDSEFDFYKELDKDNYENLSNLVRDLIMDSKAVITNIRKEKALKLYKNHLLNEYHYSFVIEIPIKFINSKLNKQLKKGKEEEIEPNVISNKRKILDNKDDQTPTKKKKINNVITI